MKLENLLQNYRQQYNTRKHLGLDRINFILSKLNNPQNDFWSIHIAGTNGKGSTSSMLHQVFKDLGLQVGLFTSPHLERFTERIKINNNEILEYDFLRIFEKNVKPVIDNLDLEVYGLPTEFEIITIITFCYFSEQKIDVAIIESGLGGRLDATNVLENVLLSIITSVSLDHTDRLGDTIEKITLEKVGIIKSNIPVVTTKLNLNHELYKEKTNLISFSDPSLFKIKSKNVNYKTRDGNNGYINNGILLLCEDITSSFYGKEIFLPFLAEYQIENLSIVLKSLDLIFENIYIITKLKNINKEFFVNSVISSISNTRWSGRFEFFFYNRLTTILDGAHNEEGLKELVYNLSLIKKEKKIITVFACNKNKEFEKMLDNLSIVTDYFLITQSHVLVKAQDINLLSNYLNYKNKNNIIVKDYRLINEGISKIIDDNLIDRKDCIINICGSLYLVGALRSIINQTLGGYY